MKIYIHTSRAMKRNMKLKNITYSTTLIAYMYIINESLGEMKFHENSKKYEYQRMNVQVEANRQEYKIIIR